MGEGRPSPPRRGIARSRNHGASRGVGSSRSPAPIYNNRNRVERLWARLKEWRAVATRYEKTAASFLGILCLAATVDCLRPKETLAKVAP